MKGFLLILLLLTQSIFSQQNPSILYKTIPPTSVSKHLAFYKLYPDTREGQLALKEAFKLLSGSSENFRVFDLPKVNISSIVQIVTPSHGFSAENIEENDLMTIEKLSQGLKNRSLKTHNSLKDADFINAAPEDIDIAKALFVAQFGSDTPEARKKIRFYEASIDLMALQVLATLPPDPTDTDKIKAINKFIFFDMGFRFPPLSTFSKNVDTFTLLPSVIDSRKGVCLGISILYLCIAQRIDLPLEIITPPGHIFVRYRNITGDIINIETTARGINIPSEHYLSMEIKYLQQRNNKETVGLAFVNEASVYLKDNDFQKAASLYEKAQKYLPDDFLVKQLLGFSYLMIDKNNQGMKLLQQIENLSPDYYIAKDTLASDFLTKKIDKEGIKAVFTPYDEERNAILKKTAQLQRIIKKYPKFKLGALLLANTHLQLGRTKEALKTLENYFNHDPSDHLINFYLALLSFERFDYAKAKKYLSLTENILKKHNYIPKEFLEFKETLIKTSF